MKKYFFALLILSGLISINAQNSLTVHISNIKNPKGTIEIGIFNSEKNFLKEGFQYLKKRIKISKNIHKIEFADLPHGEYAVAVFHDENQNGICDTNLIGIPKEGYGFSNNFRPKLAAPKFHQSKFKMDRNKEIEIRLIH